MPKRNPSKHRALQSIPRARIRIGGKPLPSTPHSFKNDGGECVRSGEPCALPRPTRRPQTHLVAWPHKPGDAPTALNELTDPAAVVQALAEFDQLGRRAFLERYGFGETGKTR